MDVDRIEFSHVAAQGRHVHAFIDRYLVGQIWPQPDGWRVVGYNDLIAMGIPNEDEAREVLRVWLARSVSE